MKLFQSKGYKVISGFIYGWGASCVIIGALFKIMHFPGAGIVLTVGMLVEAFIFFVSAFEPQMEHYDWSRVFPQLGKRGIREGAENPVSTVMSGSSHLSQSVNNLNGLEQRDIEDLKGGIRKIVYTADSLATIAKQAPEVAQKMDRISGTFEQLDQNTRQVNTALENSAKELACGYSELNRIMTNSTRDLSQMIRDNCGKMVAGMQQSGEQFAALGKLVEEQARRMQTDSNLHSQELAATTQNIATLNALYEIQVKETKESLDVLRGVHGETNEVLRHIAASRENAGRFKQETQELAAKVTSLNGIYGNMLSLVNNN